MATLETPDAFWDNAEHVCRAYEGGERLPNYEGLCMFVASGPTAVPMICHTFINSEGQRCWRPIHQGAYLNQAAIGQFLKSPPKNGVDIQPVL
jgi:hypothetical protein